VAVGRAAQPAVVADDRDPVAGEPHIEFDPRAAKPLSLAKPGQRILRRDRCGAAMADDRREV
jgi:hypothetical protein